MKHAANRSPTAVKPKAKTLTQVKTVEITTPAAKKPTGKIALKSDQSAPVQKTKAAAKSSARTAQTVAKQNVLKISAKDLDAPKIPSARKIKPIIEQVEKPKTGKTTSKNVAESTTKSAQKPKKVSPNPKVVAVEKKIRSTVTQRTAKPKTISTKPQVSAKQTIKSSIKATKSQSSKVVAQPLNQPLQPKMKIVAATAKFEKTKVNKKVKAANQKAESVAPLKKSATDVEVKPIVTAKPVERKKITPNKPSQKADRQLVKIQPIVSAKKIVAVTEKIKPMASAQKIVKETAKLKAVEETNGKSRKLKSVVPAAPIKKREAKPEKVVLSNETQPVEKVFETTQTQLPKPKNKKAKPIGSAVFRGKKERYDFKVFALNEIFESIPAVYIISKRKTDKRKKGHHALICIGETASISDELKRHRKGKCVKKHEANVVSILTEADEKTRLKIETDLKAAHHVACQLD